MCFYECILYECKCWKWGNFRQHCQKEYRIGETCGTRFVHSNVPNESICATCSAIKRKQNRYAKAMADYQRWRDDPTRKASAEKALEDCHALRAELDRLARDKQARYMAVGSNRRNNA